MSFNVTQCPACASTFNTNRRVLAAAAGRVRCGACLNVFEAIDNFLLPDEPDSAHEPHESVFVGNDPQEFFDPSSFLTRSALREPQADQVARDETTAEKDLHQELERSETVGEDFFASVAGELQGRETALDPLLEAGALSETEAAHEPTEASDSLPASSLDEDGTAPPAAGIPEPHTTQTTETRETRGGDSLHKRATPELATAPRSADPGRDGEAASESFLEAGLSASFTFGPHTASEVRVGKNRTVISRTASGSESAASARVADQDTSEAEAELDEHSEALQPDEAAKEVDRNSPIFDDSELSQIHNEATHAFVAAEDESPITPASAEPGTTSIPTSDLPTEVSDEAVDYELASSEAETEDRTETDDIAALVEHATLERSITAEAEETTEEVSQPEAPEVNDQSTEAIRARALEAELDDDEALEAIPRENLAALGSMSTPVELLAGKESRILRSTLLLLSILLLGGLLSSQYLWQRMELYSQLPQLRGLYELGCTYLGCELPEFTDIDSIRSENLSVQTHPSYANGLMVNTVVRNTSAFAQPFPILILSFNSAENSVIALREFTSDEYLDPGLQPIQAMPPMTPVQISLAIMDPGPAAVNYTLAFRWP